MRASYRAAIDWIVANDDIEWLICRYGSISVTAALVADLFGKTDKQVTADIRRKAVKERGSKYAAVDSQPYLGV